MADMDTPLPHAPIVVDPGDVADIIREADNLERLLRSLPSLGGSLQSIINASNLDYRRKPESSVDTLPKLLSPSPPSPESDDILSPSDNMALANLSAVSFDEPVPLDSLPKEFLDKYPKRQAVIGGATVTNICLVVMNEEGNRFGDLPVNVLLVDDKVQSRLIAPLVKGDDDKPEVCHVLLHEERQSPDDVGIRSSSSSMTIQGLAGSQRINELLSVNDIRSQGGDSTGDGQGTSGGQTDLGKAELNEYILSGDIENFFGIKGLAGKLYKYQGPEKDEEESPPKKDEKKPESESQLSGEDDSTNTAQIEPGTSQPRVHAAKEEKSEKPGVSDGQGGGETKKEKEGPAREKVKLNPQSTALKGMPLGVIFPFLDNEEIQYLPVENLEFTYSEEKKNFLFPPGLRLEADVPLKGVMQWAGDAMQNILGARTPPKMIHMSAHLSDERDWSKRPKIEKLVLQGTFKDAVLKPWDFLDFQTVGVEIKAEKASKKTDSKEGKKSKESKETADDKKSGKEKEESTPPVADSSGSTGTEMMAKGETALSTTEEKGEKQIKDKGEEKGTGSKEAWFYSFGLIGTLQFTNLAHTNAPLLMSFRLGRDFAVKEGKKDKADKGEKKDKSNDTREGVKDEAGDNQVSQSAASDDKGKQEGEQKGQKDDQGKPKDGDKSDAVKHLRTWSLVIISDEWKDVCNIKSLEMSEATLKMSFQELSFRKSVKLELSAGMKLGGIKLAAEGLFSRDENLISAEVGDLSLSKIKRIHAQLTGQKSPTDDKNNKDDDTAGNEISFKKFKLSLSRKKVKSAKSILWKKEVTKDNEEEVDSGKAEEDQKSDDDDGEKEGNSKETPIEKKDAKDGSDQTEADEKPDEETETGGKTKKEEKKKETVLKVRNALELEGVVAFNEHASVNAAITFASDGIEIKGGVSDFEIPNTEITVKKAGLQIFIGFRGGEEGKSKKKKTVDDGPKAVVQDVTDQPSGGKNNDSKDEDTIDESPLDEATKDEKDEKPEELIKGPKRESKFGVLGSVQLGEITVKVGLYTARKKDAKEREWLVFGAIENVKLAQIWPDIPRNSFLNMELNNVAAIASSHDRKKKKKDNKKGEKEEGYKEKDKKRGEYKDEKPPDEEPKGEGRADARSIAGDETDYHLMGGEIWESSIREKHDISLLKKDGDEGDKSKKKGKEEEDGKKEKDVANWDVLAEVDLYNYPIIKGFQICATITSLTQLEQLNDGKKMESLTLILSISSQGKIEASIDLPESMRVNFSPDAYLGNFGGAIGFGGDEIGPELRIMATLTWCAKDTDPICVDGILIGRLTGMKGMLKMTDESQWVNPFNLNKNLVVSRLGIQAGFHYATVCVTGPDELALSGDMTIGDTRFSLVMGVRTLTADAVLRLQYDGKLDVLDIVDMAGTLTELEVLKAISASGNGRGLIVFEDLLLYLSSGGFFLNTYFERGIQVRGKLDLFGKRGEFDGSIDDKGVVIKAAMDNFKIGGLEVRSTRPGEKRAVMDIEMTQDKQRVFIDGMIRYYAFEFAILIDADLQKQYLLAKISLKFTDALSFELQAMIDARGGSMETALVVFEGDLKPDIVGAFFDGVEKGIKAIEHLATQAIENLEKDLQAQIDQDKAELDVQKDKLDKLQSEVNEKVRKRQEKVGKQLDVVAKLRNDLEASEKEYNKVKEAKDKNDAEVEARKRKRDEAVARLDKKEGELRKEWQGEVDRAEQDRKDWEEKRRLLEEQKEASWGDKIRSYETVEKSWKWWCALEEERYDWKCRCEKNLDDAFWPHEKAYWWVKLVEATAGLEEAHARKAIDTELKHAAQAIFSLPAFIDMEHALKAAVAEIEKFGRALGKLINGEGVIGYLKEMAKGEHDQINLEISILDELLRKQKELTANLKIKGQWLNNRKAKITERERQASAKIESLKGDKELVRAQKTYDYEKHIHDKVEAQMKVLMARLEDVRNGIHFGSQMAQQVVSKLKEGIPRITRIHVKASSAAVSNSQPILFEIYAEWLQEETSFSISWAPDQSISDLFRRTSNKLITGQETEMDTDPKEDPDALPPISSPSPPPPSPPPEDDGKDSDASEEDDQGPKEPVKPTIYLIHSRQQVCREPVMYGSRLTRTYCRSLVVDGDEDHSEDSSWTGHELPMWRYWDRQETKHRVSAVVYRGKLRVFDFNIKYRRVEVRSFDASEDYGDGAWVGVGQFGEGTSIGDRAWLGIMATAVFRDRLYFFGEQPDRSGFVNVGWLDGDDELAWHDDDARFSFGHYNDMDKMNGALSTVVWKGDSLFVFYRGGGKEYDNSYNIFFCHMDHRGFWSSPRRVSYDKLIDGRALAAVAYRDTLYLFHQCPSFDEIFIHQTENPFHESSWDSYYNVIPGSRRPKNLAAVVHDDKLFVYATWKTDGLDCLHEFQYDGKQWRGPVELPGHMYDKLDSGLAAAVYDRTGF